MDTLNVLTSRGEYLQCIPVASALDRHLSHLNPALGIKAYFQSATLQSGCYTGFKAANPAIAKVDICKFCPVAIFDVV